MNVRTRRAALASVAVLGFATLSGLAFLGYLTPEMMVYFITFRWCF